MNPFKFGSAIVAISILCLSSSAQEKQPAKGDKPAPKAPPKVAPKVDDSAARGHIKFDVPDGAVVKVDGVAVESKNKIRQFDSAIIKDGAKLNVEVLISWTEGGKPLQQKFSVTLERGDRKSLAVFAKKPNAS